MNTQKQIHRNRFLGVAVLVALSWVLSACAPLLLGGAATSAIIANDRRTSGTFLEDANIELKVNGKLDTAMNGRGHVSVTSFNRRVLLTGEVATPALNVFGVHCIGGIVGAIGTAIVADPALGGQGFLDYTVFPAGVGAYDMGAQLITQIKAVAITLLWSGVATAVLFFILDKTLGLRPSEDAEREGLDLSSHGERAYNY